MPTLKDIKAVVTHFSEEVRTKAEDMEEIKVAGRIIDIIPPISLLNEEGEEDPMSMLYALKVDDYVGSIYVYVSLFLMKHYEQKVKINNFLVFHGFARIIDRKINHKTRRESSVIAYDVAEFPKEAVSV